MLELNPRQQSLITAFKGHLESADAFTADAMLKDVEASVEYGDPSHGDHAAFIAMVPLALGHRMKLSGVDPDLSGTDMDSSMLDNQRYSFDLYPQEPKLDFSDEDTTYQKTRDNAQNYLSQLEKNEVSGIDSDERDIHLKAARQNIIDIDTNYASAKQSRDTELDRINKQEDSWAAEQATRAAEMKKDFMAVRMKNILPDERETYQALANEEWSRLSQDYGF